MLKGSRPLPEIRSLHWFELRSKLFAGENQIFINQLLVL